MARRFSRSIRIVRRLPKRRVTSSRKFSFENSSSVSSRVSSLISECSLEYINPDRIFCVESEGSRSRAYARIWGLARIWQNTLNVGPAYVLEATHRFQKLNTEEQNRVLLHELAHIPKNFSGALIGHNGLERRVQEMIRNSKSKKIDSRPSKLR